MTPEETPAAKPDAELTDADLDQVAGGVSISREDLYYCTCRNNPDKCPVHPNNPDPNPRGAMPCE